MHKYGNKYRKLNTQQATKNRKQ